MTRMRNDRDRRGGEEEKKEGKGKKYELYRNVRTGCDKEKKKNTVITK